jgi:hypothetical protein
MQANPMTRVFSSTRRRLLTLALAGGAAAAGAGLQSSRPSKISAQGYDPFVGAWHGNFSRSDGQMIAILQTVDENGTLITSSSDNLAGSSSHGHWKSLGNNQYSYSQVRMNTDVAGNYSGLRAIDADVTLDSSGNTWTSTTKITFYDMNGNVAQTITSSGTGVRIPFYNTPDTRPQAYPIPPAAQ